MTNILNKINSLFPISDDTVQVLKENVTCCRFPKKYQLIKADTYCKSAFFIEKGITRFLLASRRRGGYDIVCRRRKHCVQYG